MIISLVFEELLSIYQLVHILFYQKALICVQSIYGTFSLFKSCKITIIIGLMLEVKI